MTDPATQLATLRALRDAAADPGQRAALDAAIAALEAQQPGAHTQAIAGEAQLGAAVAGDVRGGITQTQQSGGVNFGSGNTVEKIGDVVAPLFSMEANGNYIASVINLYQHAPGAQSADYGAALRRYLKHLYSLYATLDLRGIDDRPMDMPLSEIYVSLSLHEPLPDELRGRGALRRFMDKVMRTSTVAEQPSKPEPVDWTVALRHPRLAVVGAPGGGKTTLLHYSAVRLCEVLARDDRAQLIALGLADATQANTAPPVPLLLPLRELGSYLGEAGAREAAGANPQLLLNCLANYYGRADLDLPPDFFSRLCDTGRAILLLDGLDEVVKSDDRAFVSSIVRSFAQRYADCRYVVTARVAAYQGDAQIGAGFHICTIADLDAEQQQRFITNWSRSLHRLLYNLSGTELEQATARYTGDLWHALKQNVRVRDLATNPLLLTVVAVIFHNNYVLPEDRAALYEECVEVLLRGGRGKADRAAQQRAQYGGQADQTMGLNHKRELLSAVAYSMHQRGEDGVFISKTELIRLVAAQLRHRPDADTAARAFVDELPVHIGLLDEREPDRFRFSHLSFQEFLAARHIAEATEARWEELLAHYQETWWREVILLCAGHLSQARCWTFLEQLLQQAHTWREKALTVILAADALDELERFKGEDPLREKVIQQASEVLAAMSRDVPARALVRCGELVGQRDPRAGVCTLPPAMVRIEGGNSVIGKTRRTKLQNIEINDQALTLRSFELARYPVTNAQYALFVADDGYNIDRPWWNVTQLWLRSSSAHKQQNRRLRSRLLNHPVVNVSWYEAMAFCRWLSQSKQYNPQRYTYVLPSEAEWEVAARGTERRTYPWGNETPDAERANFGPIYGGTTAVGSFPGGATPQNVLDLAGNVWEWTRSEFKPYPYDPDDGRETLDNAVNKQFTLRGGSWYNQTSDLRASSRTYYSPDFQNDFIGFRLARHL